MKKLMIIWNLILVFSLYSQTTSTSTSTSGSRLFDTTTTRRELTPEEEARVRISSIITSTIGSKLRSPDANIKKQALTYLVSLLGSSEIFNTGTGRTPEQTIGAVGVNFISDLFLLRNDSDPEVSDLARVALDVLFGTQDTFLKYMEDPDPIVRKYAIRIYTERCLSAKRSGDTGQADSSYISQLTALRSLLVRLKYEKDEGIRKTLSDAIEQFLVSSPTSTQKGRMVVDQTIINYLNDENPDVRKNALKIIAAMEYNPTIFNILLERLKVEKDEKVKSQIERTIEIIAGGVRSGAIGEVPQTPVPSGESGAEWR